LELRSKFCICVHMPCIEIKMCIQTVYGTTFCHSSDQHAKCVEKRLISYKSSETCENLCCVVCVFYRQLFVSVHRTDVWNIDISRLVYPLSSGLQHKAIRRMCFGLLVINFGKPCAWRKGSSFSQCITNYARYILLPVQVFKMSVRKFTFYITALKNWRTHQHVPNVSSEIIFCQISIQHNF
jgi:hypothetical protein